MTIDFVVVCYGPEGEVVAQDKASLYSVSSSGGDYVLDGPFVTRPVASCTITYTAAWVPRTSARPRSSPRPAGGIYLGAGRGHWVSRTLDGGRIVVLEDGSMWEVGVLDRIDTLLWLPTEKVTVLDGDGPLYSHRLVNTDAGDVVEARYLGKQ